MLAGIAARPFKTVLLRPNGDLRRRSAISAGALEWANDDDYFRPW